MFRRTALAPVLVALSLAACVAGAGTAHASGLVLDVYWRQGVEIDLALPSGAPVTAGSVLPAGTYAITIYNDFRDDESLARMFHLFGPGVDASTDMNQGEMTQAIWTVTLEPNSTYQWQDDYRAGAVSGSFRTGASAPAATAAPAPTAPGRPSAKTGGTTPNTDLAGSAVAPSRGVLAAVVDARGRLSLSRSGKGLPSLRSGAYSFRIVDRSRRAGFVVQRLHGAAKALSSAGFVGTRTVKVTLRPGQWFFYSPRGQRHYFIVVA